MARPGPVPWAPPAIRCYACEGRFPLSHYPIEFNEEGRECCPDCGSEFVERLEEGFESTTGSGTGPGGHGVQEPSRQSPVQPPRGVVSGPPPPGGAVPRSLPFGPGPRIEFHATFDHRPVHLPTGPLTFVDAISRFAPVNLPNGQQAFVLQVQDGALLSPFTMGMPFGEAFALNPADWVVGDDLDAVVSRVLDAYMPPRRATAQEVCDALPRLRVRSGPLSPRPTAGLEGAALRVSLKEVEGAEEEGPRGACGRSCVRLRLDVLPGADSGAAGAATAAAGGGAAVAKEEKPGVGVPSAARTTSAAAAGACPASDGFASCQPGEVCTVCHDAFEAGTEVVELPCHHCFHESCIIPWLQQQNTCPVCRKRLREAGAHAGRTSASSGGAPYRPYLPQQHQHHRAPTTATAAAPSVAVAGTPATAPAPAGGSDAELASTSAAASAGSSTERSGATPPASAPEPSPSSAPATGHQPSRPQQQQQPQQRRPAPLTGVRPVSVRVELPDGLALTQTPVAVAAPAQPLISAEALRAAEAALAPLRARFPPLDLGSPPQRPAAGEQMIPLGDLLASLAGMPPGRTTPGSSAPATASTTTTPTSGRSGTQVAGAGLHGAALRGGFFNQPVNLYGTLSARGTPATPATSGTRSALRGGFFNSGSSGGAGGATAGTGTGGTGAVAGAVPIAGTIGGGAGVQCPRGSVVAGTSGSSGTQAAPPAQASSSAATRTPAAASTRAAVAGVAAAAAACPSAAKREREGEHAGERPNLGGAGKESASASAEDEDSASEGPTRRVGRHTRQEDAATLAHQSKDEQQAQTVSRSDLDGAAGAATSTGAIGTVAEPAANATAVARESSGQGTSAGPAATPEDGTAAGPYESKAVVPGGVAGQAERPAGQASQNRDAEGNADKGGRGRRVVRARVVQKGHRVAAAAPCATCPTAAAAAVRRSRAGSNTSGGGAAAGGAHASSSSAAAAGSSRGGNGGGSGHFNPVSLVLGGAGAGLRLLGGVASGLLRLGGGGGGSGDRRAAQPPPGGWRGGERGK